MKGNDMNDFFKIIMGMIFLALIILTIIFSINPKVEVFVGENLIYKGSDLCVDVSSSGYNTTVKTSKFFCLLPDKSYTDKDIVIRTVD